MTQTHEALGTTYPFSVEQAFLRGQHETDGSSAGFGLRPISSGAWRLRGPLDRARLQRALDAVVRRHEALRVQIVRTGDEWGHLVRPSLSVEPVLEQVPVVDSDRDLAVEHFVAACETHPFPSSAPAMLRVHVGELAPDDAVLVLVGFLPVVDVWSIGVVLRDVVRVYADPLLADDPSWLAAIPSYREYAAGGAPAAESDLAWWRERLGGYVPFALTSDRPPADPPSGTTRVDRFRLPAGTADAVTGAARHARATPYMVLLTLHLLQLTAVTGRPRGLVWMLTAGPGRRTERWEDVVGYFPNMCPLPVDLTGCATFTEALDRVRSAVLASFRHEVPFVQLATGAGEQIAALEQPGLVVPGFAMFQNPAEAARHEVDGLVVETVRRRLDQDAGPGIPDDAILWTISQGSGFDYALSSSVDRYDRTTMRALADDFVRGARTLLSEPDGPLGAWTPGAHAASTPPAEVPVVVGGHA